jgi:three-Cys-motif partner protein
MVMLKRPSAKMRARKFGGDWTALKLDVIANYLECHAGELRNKPSVARPYRRIYVDGFSGSGYRGIGSQRPQIFPDLAAPAPQQFLDSSAALALKGDPRFDEYLFLERSRERAARLEAMPTDLARGAQVRVSQADANAELRRLCDQDWSLRRGLILLDPYAMEIDWETVEAIAETKAIDLCLMIPLGFGVARISGDITELPVEWRARLAHLLGTSEWHVPLPAPEVEPSPLIPEDNGPGAALGQTIGRRFHERLAPMFAGVAKEPMVLRGPTKAPLYALCYAAANTRIPLFALRRAQQFLKDLR